MLNQTDNNNQLENLKRKRNNINLQKAILEKKLELLELQIQQQEDQRELDKTDEQS